MNNIRLMWEKGEGEKKKCFKHGGGEKKKRKG